MADCRAIGVFDSGVGGLTVVKEIIKLLPSENIVYFGDTKRVPYGTKSTETIIKFAQEDEAFLLSKNVKMIVAACGTVSSVAFSTGEKLPVLFTGVVSHAAVTAINATRNGKIGVIGTQATISSQAHKNEILKLMPSAKVYTKATSLFVPLVEAGWIDRNDPVVYKTAQKYLEPLKENGIDTLILGCTHYPMLIDVISDILGDNVKLINMGEATALAVKDILECNDSFNTSKDKGYTELHASDITDSFCDMATLLLGENIDKAKVTKVELDSL